MVALEELIKAGDIFRVRLMEDRAAPGSALDYFEVMFSGAVAALRKTSMGRALRQMARRDAIDDEALAAYLKRSVTGTWHASCSNRMGAADDPMAVTDSQGRVPNRTSLAGSAWLSVSDRGTGSSRRT